VSANEHRARVAVAARMGGAKKRRKRNTLSLDDTIAHEPIDRARRDTALDTSERMACFTGLVSGQRRRGNRRVNNFSGGKPL
jgi:hypothetical protein